jgi:type I restriction enzyme S subunit
MIPTKKVPSKTIQSSSFAKWRKATLADILPLKYGKARSEQFGYSRPQTATFGSNGVFGTHARALTQGPSIIIGRKGAAGAIHYSSAPCWPTDTAFYTEGNEHAFLPFFRYLLESLQLVRLDRSTAIPSLSRDDYNARVVHFPEGVPEQRRIVAEIEKQLTRLDVGVGALLRVQANIKRYRTAILKAACEGKLVPIEAELAKKESRQYERVTELLESILEERRQNWTGRGKYKEPCIANSAILPSLPNGWIWVSLSSLTRQIADVDHKMPKRVDSGIPYVSTKDFHSADSINYESAKNISEPDYQALCRKVKPEFGDLLLSRYGTVGEARLVRTKERFQASYSVAILKTFRNPVLNAYLLYSLRSEHVQNEIRRDVRASAQPDLGLEFIRQFTIALPPLAEQARIVSEVERRLSVVDELEAVVSANIQRATRLRQAILSKAFSGELTS